VVSHDFKRDGIADLAVITPGAELVVLLGAEAELYRWSFRCGLDAHSGEIGPEMRNFRPARTWEFQTGVDTRALGAFGVAIA
jgi:hypothetical protein